MSKHGPLKRGDIREDGKIFFRYDRFGFEYWYTPEEFVVLKSKEKSRNKVYKKNNRKQLSQKNKEWRHNNIDRVRSVRQTYYSKVKDKINSQFKKRLKKEPLLKAKHGIRNLISTAIRRMSYKKSNKTTEVLGCSFEDFIVHIESQFSPGMSWENHGEWHIDHIMPLSMAKNYDELVRLNHYRNLRPLWAADNIKKGATKIDSLVLF
jgi:hypothetical protein